MPHDAEKIMPSTHFMTHFRQGTHFLGTTTAIPLGSIHCTASQCECWPDNYMALQKLPNAKLGALGMDRKYPLVPNIGIFVQMTP